MNGRLRYAVIPTCCRPDDLRDCVAAIKPQVDRVIVVLTRLEDGDLNDVWDSDADDVFLMTDEERNISKWWNAGITLAKQYAREAGQPYDVAILNDDAIVPPDWFDRVTSAMSAHAAGFMSDTQKHMTGFAFILRGEAHIQADEQFVWWYGDNDIEWTARERGGVAHVIGPIEHRHPGSTTIGTLGEQTHRDREAFQNKWGRLPH